MTLGEALAFAQSRMWRTFVAGFASALVIVLSIVPAAMVFGAAVAPAMGGRPAVVGVLALAGLALLALPAVVACGYAVVVQAVTLEPIAALDGLGRSWTLTKGFRGRVFVLYLVVLCLFVLVSIPFGMVAAMGVANPMVLAVAAVLSILMMLAYPVVSAIFTVLYYDLRVRKEAFDLVLLSEQVGVTPAA